MFRSSATIRIAMGVSSLSVSVVMLAATLGLIRDPKPAVLQGRAALCESVAVSCSLLARHDDVESMRLALSTVVRRNGELLSAGVREVDGALLVEAGPHSSIWEQPDSNHSTSSRMMVPIRAGGKLWGTVELQFEDGSANPLTALGNMLIDTVGRLGLVCAFVGAMGFFFYYFYLRKVLQQLDPSQAVPERVREALDTLVEGLLVLDHRERIVLANAAFCRMVGQESEVLLGRKVGRLPWHIAGDSEDGQLPWVSAQAAGLECTGTLILPGEGDTETRTFLVNCAPIPGENGKSRGVLASFDDITPIEKKKAEMARMLGLLQESSEEIRRQNRELERMATTDPLTSCLNRRAYFERMDTVWTTAVDEQRSLSCLMVDIDHFKSINDNHGHAMGDQVLSTVAATLRSEAREHDLVCRYGGEEFCVLLPHTDLPTAGEVAENFRAAIERLEFPDLRITASLGASGMELTPGSPEELLEYADKALYMAKRNGRNQVITADQVDPDLEVDESKISRDSGPQNLSVEEGKSGIPFQAVTALISALAYRDQDTAEHSRRVADLCVDVARGTLSKTECYTLEIAALLHDIGKIGVPDSILLKPGPLTREEWEVMHTHDRIGVEIISASFNNNDLSAIIRSHHAFFGGTPNDPGLPSGVEIPFGARLLSICDSYDAMVSNRVYRAGRSRREAFDELRRCAGTQFDPQLVERFIEIVGSHPETSSAAAPPVSRELALNIGLQIEGLSTALDKQDIEGLSILAGRLKSVAANQGITDIAEHAARLQADVESDMDLLDILGAAHELLDLCRSTQKSHVETALSA